MDHASVLKTPHLSYDQEMDRWVLWLQRGQNMRDEIDQSFCMLIRCAWNDANWFSYRFVKYEAGGMIQLVTKAEYQQHVKDIEDHEGDEIAQVWEETQTSFEVVRDNHPVFALRKYWEAMMTLGLLFPAVNHREWNLGNPLPPEAGKTYC